MGVQITEILESHEIGLDDLKHKTLAVDAYNHLYQFLTTIRSRDGSLFTDSKGNVTSHLIGLFSRTARLLQKEIKLVYVFDGETPRLKHKELEKRKIAKQQAEAHYRKALEEKDEELMKKYAGRFSRLTPEMVQDAKKLLGFMGLPCIDAASEGEAQAAYMVKKGDAYAVSSQDSDSLLFGAAKLVRNLSITGRKKAPGKIIYGQVEPQMIMLDENLKKMGISHRQLIMLAMLVGTDYNQKGIKGIGPRKALDLVKKHSNPEKLFGAAKWNEHCEESWEEIIELFENMPVKEKYELKWGKLDKEKLTNFLCREHDFSEERVVKSVEQLSAIKPQRGLGDFF